MGTQHDLMSKKLPTGTSPKQPFSHTERRGSRRCKITQRMRIRPSDPTKDHFEDMRGSVSVSRSGVFFQSSEPGYEVVMRLFVTLPYSSPRFHGPRLPAGSRSKGRAPHRDEPHRHQSPHVTRNPPPLSPRHR